MILQKEKETCIRKRKLKYIPYIKPTFLGSMYSFGKSRLKKGGEKIGNFFSAKYTIRFELEIYKVGFPCR